MNKPDFDIQKSGIGGGYTNQLSASYDPSKPQFNPDDLEMTQLFNVFEKDGKIDLEEFLDILKTTEVEKNCTILTQRIREFLKKNQTKEVNKAKFTSLFMFDLTRREDFNLTFKLIDQSDSASIGLKELVKVNETYGIKFFHNKLEGLNLKNDDIKLMIENLKEKYSESVTNDELYNALYSNN